MKKQLKVNIMKSGSLNDELLKAIAGSNEGTQEVSLNDLEAFIRVKKAQYPFLYHNTQCGRYGDKEGDTIEITEDNGKTFTLSISEVEINELVVED